MSCHLKVYSERDNCQNPEHKDSLQVGDLIVPECVILKKDRVLNEAFRIRFDWVFGLWTCWDR